MRNILPPALALLAVILLAGLMPAHAQDAQVTVDSTPVANVPIQYSYDSTTGTGLTLFVLSIPSGSELTLDAPATHVDSSYMFYVFSGWTYDGSCSPDGSDSSILSCSVGDSDFAATAHYTQILSIAKELVSCSYVGDGGSCDPDNLPLNTLVSFHMKITFHAYDTVTDVKVKDGIGADLALNSPTWFTHVGGSDPTSAKAGRGKNKMGATLVTWTIGDVSDPFPIQYALDLYVHTGLNPKDKQEYTQTGTHYLNSGPEVYFTYNEVEYMLQGPSVFVIVV